MASKRITQTPEELLGRIKIACEPIRLSILKLLLERGKVHATELGVIRSKNYHLQLLAKGQMVSQEGVSTQMVYRITPIGKDVLRRFEP